MGVAGLLAGLSSCTTAESGTAPAEPIHPVNRIYDDAARFLAGMPGRPGSKYAEWEKSAAWVSYSEGMTKVWTRAEERRVKPVREFQQAELGGAAAASRFVFYPFSGPDIVYVQSFYPNASTYVLAGLERPGSIPGPEDYRADTLAEQLDGVRRGSASLFDRSFFITNEMSSQFRGRLTDGLLPVALLLMARMGNTIDNVRYVTAAPDGSLTELAAPQPNKGRRPDGVEIAFHRNGETKRRLLYYFRVDLGWGLKQDPSFLEFLRTQGRPEVFVKSASFLLHSPNFSTLREYLLTNASRVVQDDTGIPFKVYREGSWNVQLFGSYRRPYAPFQNRYQTDLMEAYEEPGSSKPLKFSMGYGTGRQPTIVLLATPPPRS